MHSKFTHTIQFQTKDTTTKKKKKINGQKLTETGSLGTECRGEAYFPESQLLCRPTYARHPYNSGGARNLELGGPNYIFCQDKLK